MGLHPQIRLNIRLSPEALMNKAFTDLTSQAQEVGTHVENLDTRASHQVAQMGRSGPQPSSQQTVTARNADRSQSSAARDYASAASG